MTPWRPSPTWSPWDARSTRAPSRQHGKDARWSTCCARGAASRRAPACAVRTAVTCTARRDRSERSPEDPDVGGHRFPGPGAAAHTRSRRGTGSRPAACHQRGRDLVRRVPGGAVTTIGRWVVPAVIAAVLLADVVVYVLWPRAG